MYVIPVMVTMKNKLKFIAKLYQTIKITYNYRNNERNNNHNLFLTVEHIKGVLLLKYNLKK